MLAPRKVTEMDVVGRCRACGIETELTPKIINYTEDKKNEIVVFLFKRCLKNKPGARGGKENGANVVVPD